MLALVPAEEVYVLVLVASGNKFFQSKELKVVSEISEEIAHARVVAITQHGLAAEVLAVMPQLVVDVFQLRVELVFLGLFCLVQILISHTLNRILPLLIKSLAFTLGIRCLH